MSVVFKSYPLENDLEMAAVVLGGLPSSVVKRVGAFLGIRAAKVGSIVKISEKTLDRRLKSGARLKPDESERLARLRLDTSGHQRTAAVDPQRTG
jgi:putative toxin-antitoxin system antitoxin component (TIGR02293 family)